MQLVHQLRPFAIELVRLCIWLALLMAIFVPIERRFALHPQKVFRKAFVTDLAYYFLSGLVPNLLLVLPMSAAAWALHKIEPSALYARMGELPVWVRLVAGMVVGEIGSYWGHRSMHAVPWLWRFHAIHHSAEEIDWLVNTRAHPVDLAFTRLCAFLPMYVLGLAQPMAGTLDLVPVLITLVGTVWGFFIHANVKWRFGKLEWLISTPAFHHWHHTNDGPETIDKNFAPMLPWVDRCFGTFYLPKKDWPAKYGTDAALAPGLGGQLLQPLAGQD